MFHTAIDSSIHGTLSNDNQSYSMILQPQQANMITQQSQMKQSQDSIISSSLEQQSIILPQNTHLVNTTQQSQEYFTTLSSSTNQLQLQNQNVAQTIVRPTTNTVCFMFWISSSIRYHCQQA